MTGQKKTRILIAEDDYLVSESIKRAVAKIGYELVGKASDGVEAVELACALQPDVILMDIKMPEMDGLEAARRILEVCPIPIVVLTAHESQDLVEKASATGIGAYLTKPPQQKEIERAVTIALARHDDLMQLRKLNAKLEKALAEIKTLRGILPFCSFCNRIRNENGNWENVDVFIYRHSEADVSHGICPDCEKEFYTSD